VFSCRQVCLDRQIFALWALKGPKVFGETVKRGFWMNLIAYPWNQADQMTLADWVTVVPGPALLGSIITGLGRRLVTVLESLHQTAPDLEVVAS
jgi:hypothetical protein